MLTKHPDNSQQTQMIVQLEGIEKLIISCTLVPAAIKNAKLSALLILPSLSYHKTENFQIDNFSKNVGCNRIRNIFPKNEAGI